MKTFVAKSQNVKHDWHLVDASNQCLGRLAADIALRLRGKHNPQYTPHVDTGDFIVVINAGKLTISGKKSSDKIYHRHSGYVGGLRSFSFNELHGRHPSRVLELAVKGMLPRGPLGRAMFKKLKVYPGIQHKHAAQTPTLLKTLIFRK